jgi:hypothetical protein
MARTPIEPRDRSLHSGQRHTNGQGTGARAADGEPHRKRRLGWLWWLLGLLALAAIVALLAGLLGNDDDDGGNAANNSGQSGQSATAGGDNTAAGLSAGGTQLLPVPSGGLGNGVGQQAQGRDVIVQSVVRGQEDPDALEGFWVGSSQQDRVYVEWGGDVGSDEATYVPKEGEKVNLSGPVRPAPEDPEQTLNLNAADAELVRSQGGYVNADEVAPSDG